MSIKKEITVLVGGCFDVLHPGHIIFLEKAKRAGDKLIVLLESDEKIKRIKGVKRPVHNQEQRALVLKALRFVDEIVMLPFLENNKEYDDIIKRINPDIIAVTEGYPNIDHHRRSAEVVGAELKYVTKVIGNHSTSRILKR